MNTKEPDRSGREQIVDRRLHVGAHMSRKLPRGRDHLVIGHAGEMPLQRFAGEFELLGSGDVRHIVRDGQRAVVADGRSLAGQPDLVLAGKVAAQFAGIASGIVAGLGRHQQRVSGCLDALLGGLKQHLGDRARIGPAHGLPSPLDRRHHRIGVVRRLAKDRADKADNEILRRLVVVVNDELEVIGLSGKGAHGRSTPEKLLSVRD